MIGCPLSAGRSVEFLYGINPGENFLQIDANLLCKPVKGLQVGPIVLGNKFERLVAGNHALAYLIAAEGIKLGKARDRVKDLVDEGRVAVSNAPSVVCMGDRFPVVFPF